jgi:CheY-like chemotaxis protein
MKRKTLLIADDSLVMRLKIEDSLSELKNIEILQAKDGVEALKLIQETSVDGLILDSLMPRLDGYGVLEKIKANNINVNVVVLTADIQNTTKQKYLNLGAKDVLHKPFKKDELLNSINRNFGLFQNI